MNKIGEWKMINCKIIPKFISIVLFSILLLSCANGDQKAILGRWETTTKHDDREDTYIFKIDQDIWGKKFGTITTYMNGNLLPATRISKIEFDYPHFSMIIENPTVPLKYTGKMNDDKTKLIGKFDYINPNIASVNLTLTKNVVTRRIEEYIYQKPENREFVCNSASNAGLDEVALEDMINSVRKNKYGLMNSILIFKNNSLILEEYFGGFRRDMLHQTQSITKSVTSLLIGIAIDKGFIQSVDDKALNYLSKTDHAEGWEDVTIKHLLTMTSGVEWKKSNNIWRNDETITEILSKPIENEPGSRFRYNSAMQLLAEVLANASGEKLEVFAENYLFYPLGIKEYQWTKSNKNDYPLCTGSLQLKSVDLLKIGILVLQNGNYHEIQIVSKDWIKESTSVQIEIPKNKEQHYGYLWWRGKVQTKSGDFDTIFAHGHGSQFIFVIPENNIIIVTTGNNLYNKKRLAPFKILKKYLKLI